jgi:hypothetical protein
MHTRATPSGTGSSRVCHSSCFHATRSPLRGIQGNRVGGTGYLLIRGFTCLHVQTPASGGQEGVEMSAPRTNQPSAGILVPIVCLFFVTLERTPRRWRQRCGDTLGRALIEARPVPGGTRLLPLHPDGVNSQVRLRCVDGPALTPLLLIAPIASGAGLRLRLSCGGFGFGFGGPRGHR